MDDSLYKFYDDKSPESPEEKIQSNLKKETSTCDFSFDYESVADSSRNQSETCLSEFEVPIENVKSKAETEFTGKPRSLVEDKAFSRSSPNAEETSRKENLRRKSKENIKSKISNRKLTPYPHNCDKYALCNFKYDSRNYLSRKDFSYRSGADQVEFRQSRDIFAKEFSSDDEVNSDYGQASSSSNTIYTDDGENIHASITTAEGESRETILKTENLVQPTNTPMVKYASDSEPKTIDKSTYEKIQNDGKTRSMNTNFRAFPKRISANTTTYTISKPEQSVKCTPRNCKNKAAVPRQVKASAFLENGELAVIVTDDDSRNPIRENLNVKITVIHKYSRHMLEERNKISRRPKGNKSKSCKGLKAPADRNVVENRANWPEFNTALTEEANKRYLNRLGL